MQGGAPWPEASPLPPTPEFPCPSPFPEFAFPVPELPSFPLPESPLPLPSLPHTLPFPQLMFVMVVPVPPVSASAVALAVVAMVCVTTAGELTALWVASPYAKVSIVATPGAVEQSYSVYAAPYTKTFVKQYGVR